MHRPGVVSLDRPEVVSLNRRGVVNITGVSSLRGDFDRQALWKLENGKKHLTVYSLHKLCDSLGITVEEFFKGFYKK